MASLLLSFFLLLVLCKSEWVSQAYLDRNCQNPAPAGQWSGANDCRIGDQGWCGLDWQKECARQGFNCEVLRGGGSLKYSVCAGGGTYVEPQTTLAPVPDPGWTLPPSAPSATLAPPTDCFARHPLVKKWGLYQLGSCPNATVQSGESCILKCSKYITPVGDLSVNCKRDGTWSKPAGTCIDLDFYLDNHACPHLQNYKANFLFDEPRRKPRPIVINKQFAPILTTLNTIAHEFNVQIQVFHSIRSEYFFTVDKNGTIRYGAKKSKHKVGGAIDFSVYYPAAQASCGLDCLKSCYHNNTFPTAKPSKTTKRPKKTSPPHPFCSEHLVNFVARLKQNTNWIYAPYYKERKDFDYNHIEATSKQVTTEEDRVQKELRDLCMDKCPKVKFDKSACQGYPTPSNPNP